MNHRPARFSAVGVGDTDANLSNGIRGADALKQVSEHIPGYSYGTAEVAPSSVSMRGLEDLKISAGLTDEDECYLRLAGEVLAD